MEWITDEHFENETISFDGFNFKNCTFRKCVIMIQSLDINLVHCAFFESMLYIKPLLSIVDISHRLSKSTYDKTTYFIRNDCRYPRTVLQLPTSITT